MADKLHSLVVIYPTITHWLNYLGIILKYDKKTNYFCPSKSGGHCVRDRMVVGFTTTYAIGAYHHWCCEFEVYMCDKVCQWLAEGQLFSQGTPVSSTNKTDRHNITEILLTVALNTIKLNQILENLLINNYIDLY
jgi:hypothetical protein